MRSITTLTADHVGLHIRVIDGPTVLTGVLIRIEAVPTSSPNAHPGRWLIEIGSTTHLAAATAQWQRQDRIRSKRPDEKSFWL